MKGQLMSTRTILVVFLALVCGASMAIGVLKANRTEVDAVQLDEMEDVVIAVENIERGRSFETTAIALQKWPKGLAPETAARKIEETKDKVLITPVLKGELILRPKLADKDAGMLDVRVPPGKRAFTVMASRVPTNVGGFVLPGSIVDVLLNFDGRGAGDSTGGGSTTTLLQAVKVLAVDQRLDVGEAKVDRKSLSSVTLEVTPDQANMLDLGQNMGTLSLSLRNPTDRTDVWAEPATVAKMRFHAEPAPAPETSPLAEVLALAAADTPRPAAASPSIITWRGGQRSRVWLTEENR